ncbi:4-(cytidine 5'-diphospho)-2-C-methyl-D-erythritol kinase [Aureimonas sp. AU40]|uniref:4-(cytidine 5'-diphospho)-2-C-methyl-D-erythritol kinase n=1 Tax=Aureimonas sp. AU40 TaxID=1637747 RepID=UPI000782E9E9|nr:4-(cytidine 5'-diphospho)-2-C-methyl-D-erythritol kinase [Aureimonas sp. AU40]
MDLLEPSAPALHRAALAPAKINLALHVTGRRENGYHDLDSLVVFAREGDRLTLAPSHEDRLTIDGPFASGLPLDRGNLVLRALDLARVGAAGLGLALPPLHIHLQKNLPLASGIGGGSADAAALLRMLGAIWPAIQPALATECLALGADVPMCLSGRAARVRGVGEIAAAVPRLPGFGLLLVNCGAPVSTPTAFAGLERRDNPPLPPLPEDGFIDLAALVDYLAGTRNDLEAPARHIVPAIAAVCDALRAEEPLFHRMSGSGATVFALFENGAQAEQAAVRLRARHPGWWIASTGVDPIGDRP